MLKLKNYVIKVTGMIKLLTSISLLLLIQACNKNSDYVYYDNPPRLESRDDRIQVRDLLSNAKIDILWVVDNSGSMATIQDNIITNADLFMQNFIKNNFMKWKMGVISTDRAEVPYVGFSNVLGNKTPPSQAIELFTNAISGLGIDGSPYELVFYNVMRMITDPQYTTFFRPDAHLAIIMVTDEEEQSEGEYGSAYNAASVLNGLTAYKDAGSIIRFYGAFDFGDLKNCQYNRAEYANSPFEKIINLSGGKYMSACTPDFGKNLASIGKDILSMVDTPSITLKDRPKIETIEVYYNDILLPSGKEGVGYWYYSEYYNTINFYNMDFIPDMEKANIRIKYDINDGIDRSED